MTAAAGSWPRPAQNRTSAPARCAMIAWFSPLPPTSTVRFAREHGFAWPGKALDLVSEV